MYMKQIKNYSLGMAGLLALGALSAIGCGGSDARHSLGATNGFFMLTIAPDAE